MTQRDDGTPVFYRPDGTSVEVAPLAHHRDADPSAALLTGSIVVGPFTAMTRGDCAPLDVGWAIDILRDSPVRYGAAGEHDSNAIATS